jgi:DNA polymerase-3 subunit epsilon
MRQVVLDTETTGLEWERGHRVIEIGGVEIVNRRITKKTFHCYLNPERDIDSAATEVHGFTREDLADKPLFSAVAGEFLQFVRDAELVIHNADFDTGFINAELALIDERLGRIEDYCTVTDTLALARNLHPGQRNSLDALCKRYGVDNSQRTLHGALLDAEILADVYLSMTGGQTMLVLGNRGEEGVSEDQTTDRSGTAAPVVVIKANADEMAEHQRWLELLGENCVWMRPDQSSTERDDSGSG